MSQTAPSALLLCDRLDLTGGVERFVCQLANHLAGLGWRVAVGSSGTPAAALAYPLAPQVRLLHAGGPVAPPAERGPRPLFLLRLAHHQWRLGRGLARLARAERADVVLVNGQTAACSMLPFLDDHAAASVVCCDHNHFDARSSFWARLRVRQYPRVAAVVSLTQADAARYAGLNPVTRVIANASTLRADAPPELAAPVVLAVGRHAAQKGFDLLLRAWVQVQAQRPDARLHIVGDGPLRPAHEALAGELGLAASVRFEASRRDMPEAYRAASVFVLPSRYEGMPLALLEAQALGLPAVAFDCPTGPAEVLAPDTGRLLPLADIDGLARALLELLGDAALRQRLGRAAIERSQRLFSAPRQTARWVRLLRAVAARQPVPEDLG